MRKANNHVKKIRIRNTSSNVGFFMLSVRITPVRVKINVLKSCCTLLT